MPPFLQELRAAALELIGRPPALRQPFLNAISIHLRAGNIDGVERTLAQKERRHSMGFGPIEEMKLQIESAVLIQKKVKRLLDKHAIWQASEFVLSPHILPLMEPWHLIKIVRHMDYLAIPAEIMKKHRLDPHQNGLTLLDPANQRLGDIAVAVMESGDKNLKDALRQGLSLIDGNRRKWIFGMHAGLRKNDYDLSAIMRADPPRENRTTVITCG